MCKKILFATSDISSKGGIPRFNATLIKAFAKFECEVSIICLNSPNRPKFLDEEIKPNVSITMHSCNKNKLKFLLLCLFECIKFRPDVAICGHLNQGIPLSLIFRACCVNKRVLILHGIEVWGRISLSMRKLFLLFNKSMAVSSYTRDSFLQQIPKYDPGLCNVFPNTIDSYLIEMFNHNKKDVDEVITLLSVSRLDVTERDKGIIDVLYALSMLNIKNLKYKVVGDGNDRDYLEKIVSDLNITPIVEFTGRVSDQELLDIYQSADVFVLPSSKEGFGIVYLEAMLFQLPVIASREKGVLDVVEDSKNGFLCDYGDRKALSESIYKLACDEQVRSRMGNYGYKLVTQGGKFSYEMYLNRVKEMFLQ